MKRLLSLLVLAPLLVFAQISADRRVALDTIQANSLRGHVSFLSSDLLEGRAAPSRGLDIAAEYIASQFLRIGLEPAANNSYFLEKEWTFRKPNTAGFSLTLKSGEKQFNLSAADVDLQSYAALDGKDLPIYRVGEQLDFNGLEQGTLAGKIVAAVFTAPLTNNGREAGMRSMARLTSAARRFTPAAILIIDTTGTLGGVDSPGRIVPPGAAPQAPGIPVVVARGTELAAALNALPDGDSSATASIHIAPPTETQVRMRNVAGLLRGSDPQLKETYVVVGAHYDHVGIGVPINGDAIYNGANDDASGVASMLDIAAALMKLPIRPKRSFVFVSFYAEEKGLFGSKDYAASAPFPIDKTIAMLELEQTGRPDSDDGKQLMSANLNGFDYTTMSRYFVDAGNLTGVRVFNHQQGDAFYAASDNLSLAQAGVPAHTFSVAYHYPDYHRPSDTWEKLDYENMEQVTRAAALGLMMLGDSTEAPTWNESNPRTERYRRARQR
jgi:hypothetical protein